MQVIVGTPIKGYFCPSRRAPVVANGFALIDYYASDTTQSPGSTPWASTGVVRPNSLSTVTIVEITDGTSNTIAVSEKNLCLKVLSSGNDIEDGVGYTWGADYGGSGNWDNTLGNVNYQPQQDLPASTNCGTGTHGFGSAHIQAMNAVFADGHVQPISYSVNLTVFQNLCGTNDGNVIVSGSF